MFDDIDYVVHNDMIKKGITGESVKWAFTNYYSANWHPVTWVSYMIDYQFYGLNPAGYHIVNVIIHVLNTLLLFLFIREMMGSYRKSFFVAALYGIHPIHLESVIWISERKDVLCAMFFLISLITYVRYISGKKKTLNYTLSIMMYGIGLMAKPMIVSMPIILIMVDMYKYRKELPLTDNKRSVKLAIAEKIPYFALSLLSCAITYLGQSKIGATASFELFPLNVRLMNAIISYAKYVVSMIYPYDLTIYYPHPGYAISGYILVASIVLITGISWISVVVRNKYPEITFGWCFFIVTLIPVIGIVQVGSQGMADRYMYIPSIGLLIGAIWPFGNRLTEGGKGIYKTVIILILAGYMVVTNNEIAHWRNTDTLFKRNVAIVGENVVNQYILYTYEKATGNDPAAKKHYDRALALDKRIVAKMHNKRGYLYALQKNYKIAERELSKAIEIMPSYAVALYNMGIVMAEQGDFNASIIYLEKAIALDPKYENIYDDIKSKRTEKK